ncbi:MAG: zinc-ribbon domain-containing protein [Prevotellaceae bacterium]|jgi:prefoldin subunit 5|nr:zinc-ribbon domain-containing protein [Prevotellaceae bacterium]
MKTCLNPKCGKENPSAANFCSVCGASLANGELPLFKELEDIKKNFQHYKEELDKSDNKIKKQDSEIEKWRNETVSAKQETQQAIAEKNAVLNQQKSLRHTIAGHRATWIIFLIVSIILSGVLIVNFKDLEFNNNEKRDLERNVSSLEEKNQSLQNQINILQENVNDFQISITTLSREKDSIRLKCDTLMRLANYSRYRVNTDKTYFYNQSAFLISGDIVFVQMFDSSREWGRVEYTWNETVTKGWIKMEDLVKYE